MERKILGRRYFAALGPAGGGEALLGGPTPSFPDSRVLSYTHLVKRVTSIIDFGKHFCPGALQFPGDSLGELYVTSGTRVRRGYIYRPIEIDGRKRPEREREREREEMQKGGPNVAVRQTDGAREREGEKRNDDGRYTWSETGRKQG